MNQPPQGHPQPARRASRTRPDGPTRSSPRKRSSARGRTCHQLHTRRPGDRDFPVSSRTCAQLRGHARAPRSSSSGIEPRARQAADRAAAGLQPCVLRRYIDTRFAVYPVRHSPSACSRDQPRQVIPGARRQPTYRSGAPRPSRRGSISLGDGCGANSGFEIWSEDAYRPVMPSRSLNAFVGEIPHKYAKTALPNSS